MIATHYDYYNLTPSVEIKTGDIWSGLPTHGLLGKCASPGIVITPACDLTNHKAESVTYLPILTLEEYIYSTAFNLKLKNVCAGCEGALGIASKIDFSSRFDLPSIESITLSTSEIDSLNIADLKPDKVAKLSQYKAAISILFRMKGRSDFVGTSVFVECYKDKAKQYIENICTNSFSTDIHFLPSDKQPKEWSGVFQHSVVLFRYPLTAPLKIFELAQETTADWGSLIDSIKDTTPLAESFKAEKPVKCIELRSQFLADMISRYVSLYIRIGSPDFSERMLDQYVQEVCR